MQSVTVTKVREAWTETDEKTGTTSLSYTITSEDGFNAHVKKATEAKEPLPEIAAKQTFTFSKAETVDEAVTLAGGEVIGSGTYDKLETFLGVFNYAASLRQHNAANDLLESEGFQPTEDSRNMSYAVAEKVERAKMTPEEKSAKMLGISADQLRAALALIQAQNAQPASA